MNSFVTSKRLRELLHYDPETGVFTWVKKPNKVIPIGARAGGVTQDGYWGIRVDGVLRKAHRLAWLWCFGSLPTQHTDHINGNKLDNRIANLRDVSSCVNLQNQFRATCNSSTGLRGVGFAGGRYRSTIKANGRTVHLGMFATAEQAHAAYLKAKRIYHPEAFARGAA